MIIPLLSVLAVLASPPARAETPEEEYMTLSSRVGERLAVLSDQAKGRDAKETAKVVKVLRRVDQELSGVAPDSALKTARQRQDSLSGAVAEGKAKSYLGLVRSGLSIYYGDHDGEYPRTLDKLVPKYVEKIPALELPEHARTDKVTVIPNAKGKDPAAYIKDTGGWLYFLPDKGVPPELYGQLSIDCSHKDRNGKPFHSF